MEYVPVALCLIVLPEHNVSSVIKISAKLNVDLLQTERNFPRCRRDVTNTRQSADLAFSEEIRIWKSRA